METIKQERKQAHLNLRCLPGQRDLIDRALRATGKNLTDFVLEASCEEAKRVLMDRRYFILSPATHAEFLKRLDAPVDNEKLRGLLASKAPWER